MFARSVRSAVLIFTAGALGLGLAGCNEPKKGDMIGTWNLTATSGRYLPSDMANISPRLVLSADGRFTATDLPGEFHGSLDVVERFSGKGSWTLITKDGRQQIQLNPDDAYVTQFDIANDGEVWKLLYFLGDPDEHRRLEYTNGASTT